MSDCCIMKHVQGGKNKKSDEVSFFQSWDMKERQAKGIISSLKVYDYFGFKWDLLLNDAEFMDHLYSMNMNDRIDKRRYREYCFRLYGDITGNYKCVQKPREGFLLAASTIVHPFHKEIGRILQLWNHELGWFDLLNFKEKIEFALTNKQSINAFISEYYLSII